MNSPISLSEEQVAKITSLIESNSKEVPFFYDEGVCEILFIPIDDGELRVFHHKPKNPISKRPVLFVPGFGTSPWSWRHFSVPLYEKVEYYFLETREKSSSKITKRIKAKMSLDQTAKDVGQVIRHLKLDEKDFVLHSASYCGGAILTGLAKKYFTAPTIISYDPLNSFKSHKKYVYLIGPLPPFIISIFRYLIIKVLLFGMKNKTQKERVLDYIKHAIAWKWRKAGIHNFNFNIKDLLPLIEEEVTVFHGPLDRFHPDEVYFEIAKSITKGRYFYMNSPEEYRELLAGIMALEYSKITAEEKAPESLLDFEVELKRETV